MKKGPLNFLFVLLLLCAGCTHKHGYPAPGPFASLHPAYGGFKSLSARRASRAEVERFIAREQLSKPIRVTGKSGLLAARPPIAPSPKALALVERWPRATYAQLLDDVRVLACFDAQSRLIDYEFF